MPRMLEESLEVALRLARDAAREVMKVYATEDFGVETKADGSPVTRADKAANASILRGLSRYFPADTVLSEETPFDARQPLGRRVWMVDPVDGTQDFVQRTGDFAVMIGLCIAGRPALGVIAAPALERTWAGGPGLTPFEEGPHGRRPLRLTPPSESGPLRALVSRTHRPRALDTVLDGLQRELGRPVEATPRGGVGVKIGLLLSGEADFYLHPAPGTHLWDCCAPEALLAAAGGVFTDAAGHPIHYDVSQTANPRGVLAAGPDLHARLATLATAVTPPPKAGRG
jgi:3'(2'), 5'-bisphosphate nucleotidase